MGGPDAPALRIALALGDGGGSTTPVPEEWLFSVLVLAGVGPDCWGDDSPAALSPSDCSSGIWTLSLGLFAFDCEVLEREGGGMSVESVLFGVGASLCAFGSGGGGGAGSEACFCCSSGPMSFSRFITAFDSVEVFPMPQC